MLPSTTAKFPRSTSQVRPYCHAQQQISCVSGPAPLRSTTAKFVPPDFSYHAPPCMDYELSKIRLPPQSHPWSSLAVLLSNITSHDLLIERRHLPRTPLEIVQYALCALNQVGRQHHLHVPCTSLARPLHITCTSLAYHLHVPCTSLARPLRITCMSLTQPTLAITVLHIRLSHTLATKQDRCCKKLQSSKSPLCNSNLMRLCLRRDVSAFHLKFRYMHHPKSFGSSLLTQEPPWAGMFFAETVRPTCGSSDGTQRSRTSLDGASETKLDEDDDILSLIIVHEIPL